MSFLYASQKGTCKKCVPFVLSAEYNNLSTGRAEIIKSKAENIGRKELSCISSQIVGCGSIRLITALLVL